MKLFFLSYKSLLNVANFTWEKYKKLPISNIKQRSMKESILEMGLILIWIVKMEKNGNMLFLKFSVA